MNDDYYTIGVLHGMRGPYTYRVPADLEVTESDHVIVKNSRGISVGEVIEVHEEKQDYDPNIKYAWAFQVVDKDRLAELEAG